MNHISTLTRSRWLLLTLFTLLVGVSPAWADAKALPYSYGFEDYNLATDGWTKYFGTSLTQNNNECAIVGAAKKTGSYGFRFSSFNTSGANAQYLISPELNAPNGINVSFYYKASSSSGTEKFKVGYSTTDTDVANFTWGEEFSTNSTSWIQYENTFPAGTKYVAIYYYANYQYRLFVDDITFEAVATGPALNVLDGSTKLTSGYSYNFGLATSSDTKTFTLSNPGTESVTLNITATNGFGVSPTSTTIAAKGEETLTITMADATASGAVTISGEGIDDFVINVSGTVKDPSKYEETFAGTSIPSGWTSIGNDTGWTPYDWDFSNDGYASYSGPTSYAGTLTSPLLTFAAYETIYFDLARYGESTYTTAGVTVKYSTDGNTFTTLTSIANADIEYGNWKKFSATIPSADVKYIRFEGGYIHITNFYGGQLPDGANFAIDTDGTTQSLGAVAIGDIAEKKFTITNSGNAALPVTFTDATDFYVAKTIMFTKPNSWSGDKLYMYAWDGSGALIGAWPGQEITEAVQNDMSEWVYTARLPKGATGIKFSDNASHETGDISTEGFKDVIGLWYDGSIHTLKNDDFSVPAKDGGNSGTASFAVRMDTKTSGAKSGNIILTFDAINGGSPFTIPVIGAVLPAGAETVDFNTAIPTRWENQDNGWTIYNNEAAKCTGKKNLTTQKLDFSGETNPFFVMKVKASDSGSGDYVTVEGSTDNGATWTAFDMITKSYNNGDFGASTADYSTIVVSIPNTVNKLRFNGYFVLIDEIAGLIYSANDPAIGVYTDAECTEGNKVTTTSVTRNFDFVDEAPEAITYYIKNDGTGTMTLSKGANPTGLTISLDKTSVAAGEHATLTISKDANKGFFGGDAVVTATDLGTFTVSVSGVLVDDTKQNLNFVTDNIPSAWTPNDWEKNNGGYVAVGYSSSTLETSKLSATAGEELVVVAKQSYSSNDYKFGVKYKKDGEDDWNDLIAEANIGTSYVTLHAPIAEAGDYYFRFTGRYTQIQRIYGLSMPLEPVMVVYDGENVAGATKNFGMVSDEADAVWTLKVKNEGQAKLEGLAAALSGEQAAHYAYEINGATGAGNDEIEAGAQATITIKQLKDNLGDHEATLTISATGLDDKVITLSGSTRDHTLLYVDFENNELPEGWRKSSNDWTVSYGTANNSSTTTASSLFTRPLAIANANDVLSFDAQKYGSTNVKDLTVRYTTNGGVTWTEYDWSNYAGTWDEGETVKDKLTGSMQTFEITGIPTGTVVFEFCGKYLRIDNIQANHTMTTAPLVAFTKVTDNISDANLTADAEATYTLANIGNADYVGIVAKANVNVAISGDGVTYEANTLTIPAGKTAEITVTMPFTAPYGAKNGSMTITSESWVGEVAVNYTANLIDPDAINIDFASDPAGWYNAGWTVNGTANVYSGVEQELITEQYAAEAGKNVLSFKAKAQSGNEGTLKVYTSTDRKTWSEPTEFALTNEYATKSLAALADGNYYVKFVSSNANIDDLTGLKKIIPAPEHDLYVSTSSIPTATKVPETSITATATVYSLRADETGVYAKLFFDNVEVATADAQDISLNGSKSFELTGNVPAVEKTYAAKIVVYYSDHSVAFETLTTNVEVQHTRTLAITAFERVGEGDLSADVDNKITAQFNVTVQNNSTCDLTANEVKVSIVNAAGEVYQMNDADNVTAATAVLAKDASVVIPVTLTISAGEGGDFKFRAKELVSNTATLEANDITIHVNAQAPQFALNIKGGAALADGDDVAFGLVKEATTKQYTISNTGTKALVLTSIVAPAGYTVTEINNVNKTIAVNGTLDIDVTLLAEHGKKAGNLVFTYDVNGTPATFTLALTGRSEAANVWEEYFATEIPASWQKTGWTWNSDRQTAYSGGVQGEFTLMTPRLSAAAGQVLTYETKWQYDGENMTVQYSTDKTSWTDYETVTASTETVEHQFVAPAAGNYYLKFTANRYVNLDNFIGFALNIPEHDMELAASSVPTTGKRLNSYVATVTLKENAGKNENIIAELWVDGAKVNATADVTSVEANSNATVVTLTWEPQTTMNDVDAYVKVTYAGGTLETTPVTLTIAEVYTLSENSSDAVEAVTDETVMLQRTFAAGWNTVCLPFAVAGNTAIETLFGAGVKVFNFKNFANNMIEFEAVTSMAAATPYLIYVPAAITEPIRVNNVTITGVNTTAGTAWNNNITFHGSYAPVAAGGLNGKYGVTTANKLAKGNANTTMKGFRAYFEGTLAGARIYTFDDATGISHVYQAAEVFGDDDRVYNMNGQHVENAKKGVYIVNGRKVVIK